MTNSFSDGMDTDITLVDEDFDKCSSSYYDRVYNMAYVFNDISKLNYTPIYNKGNIQDKLFDFCQY